MLQVLDEVAGPLLAARDVRGQHTAAAALEEHLHGQIVIGGAGQAGIVDLFDLRVLLEEFRDLQGVLGVARDPHIQGAQGSCHQPGVEGAHDRTVHREASLDRRDQLGRGDDSAAGDVGVAAHILRGGVGDDVRAQFQRLADRGRSEGVVDDQLAAVLVGDLRDGLQVEDFHQRVRDGLGVQDLRVGLDGRFYGSHVGEVRERRLNAEAGRFVLQVVIDAAVQHWAGYDVIALADVGDDGLQDGRHAGAEDQPGFAAFRLCDHGCRVVRAGVAVSGIDVTGRFLGVDRVEAGNVVEREHRRHVDGGYFGNRYIIGHFG